MDKLLFKSRKIDLDDCNAIILNIKGPIDTGTVVHFEDTLTNILLQKPQSLILNMSKVTYINSSSLGVLIKIADKFQELGEDIKLVAPSERIINLLDALGLLLLFAVYDSEEQAIDSLPCKQMQ